MKKKNKPRDAKDVDSWIPSFICHVVIRMGKYTNGMATKEKISNSVSERIQCPNQIRKFTSTLVKTIGMSTLGDASMGHLDSPIAGVKSYSLNQPLITSIASVDTWPEKGEHGALVVMIHSCQRFTTSAVRSAVRESFPEAKIVQIRFRDFSTSA